MFELRVDKWWGAGCPGQWVGHLEFPQGPMELLEALVQLSLSLCMGCIDGLKRLLTLSGLTFGGVRVLILLSWLGWVGWIPQI